MTVRDNVIGGGGSGATGIELGRGSPLIEGNDISGMGKGIDVPDGATPTIRSNAIEDNTYGVVVRGQARPVIEGNRFCGNLQDLIGAEGSTWTLDPGNSVCSTD